ncbi:hypothetical protein BKA62DRAFT_767691 [Auriculariales sp. MPI-PUGE-AT-0066]|nr:hypothetical protein BKA62DRAFT_767691 [Auriculariales sp. MPI-PUGE-AT-0066]
MLKRRREPSPGLPSSPFQDIFSHPLSAFDTGLDDDERVSSPFPKRRRTHAPVLDGAHRGWDPAQLTSDSADDAEEDLDVVVHAAPSHPADTADYSSVNSLLHNLHHQRRLQSTQQSDPSAYPSSHPASWHHEAGSRPLVNNAFADQPGAHAQATSMYHPHSQHHPGSNMPHYSRRLSDPQIGPSAVLPSFNQAEEMQSVRQQYEDTNRYNLRFSSQYPLFTAIFTDFCALFFSAVTRWIQTIQPKMLVLDDRSSHYCSSLLYYCLEGFPPAVASPHHEYRQPHPASSPTHFWH